MISLLVGQKTITTKITYMCVVTHIILQKFPNRVYNIRNEILFLIETCVDVITFNNMHSLLSQLIAGNGPMIEARATAF